MLAFFLCALGILSWRRLGQAEARYECLSSISELEVCDWQNIKGGDLDD